MPDGKLGAGQRLVVVAVWVGLFSIGYSIGSCKSFSEGQECGAQELMAQVPEAKIYTERENLRKEEERLDRWATWEWMARQQCMECNGYFLVDQEWDKRVELAENIQALDTREWEQVRQRVVALGGTVEREPSIEKKMPQKIPRCLQASPYEHEMALDSTTTSNRPFKCPKCCRVELEPLIKEADTLPCLRSPESSASAAETPPVSNVKSEGADRLFEENETPASSSSSSRLGPNARDPALSTRDSETQPEGRTPEQNTLNIRPEPAAKATGPPETTIAPTPASESPLEDLAAEMQASNEETKLIGLAKEALRSRERQLQVRGEERKRRIQELNRPRSEQLWPVVKGMLVGSALAVVAVVAVGRS